MADTCTGSAPLATTCCAPLYAVGCSCPANESDEINNRGRNVNKIERSEMSNKTRARTSTHLCLQPVLWPRCWSLSRHGPSVQCRRHACAASKRRCPRRACAASEHKCPHSARALDAPPPNAGDRAVPALIRSEHPPTRTESNMIEKKERQLLREMDR